MEEALKNCNQSDVIMVHCYDNVAYMARTEMGGDLPIIQYNNGEWHMTGDLVLASKECMLMYTSNTAYTSCVSWKTGKFYCWHLSPRYLHVGYCGQPDHSTNLEDPDFEKRIRDRLCEVRRYLKDFLFINGLRGFKVLDPGRETPGEDETGEPLWVVDPV